jgi:hypothetical protein
MITVVKNCLDDLPILGVTPSFSDNLHVGRPNGKLKTPKFFFLEI